MDKKHSRVYVIYDGESVRRAFKMTPDVNSGHEHW